MILVIVFSSASQGMPPPPPPHMHALTIVSELSSFGVWVLTPLCPWPKVELVVVMVVIPLVLNTVYFWAIDNVLKRNPEVCSSALSAHQHQPSSHHPPLLISYPTAVCQPTTTTTPTPSGAVQSLCHSWPASSLLVRLQLCSARPMGAVSIHQLARGGRSVKNARNCACGGRRCFCAAVHILSRILRIAHVSAAPIPTREPTQRIYYLRRQ